MIDFADMDIKQLAAYICTLLNENGIQCVLSGGACVSIYSNNQYESYDLDFIEQISTNRKKLVKIMNSIGFEEKNRYFINKSTKYYVAFPSGPLSVGSQPVKEISTIKYNQYYLNLLSPTDCINDRLAAFFYWDDLQSLEQAKMVTKEQIIDFEEIRKWSDKEGQLQKFEEVEEELKENK